MSDVLAKIDETLTYYSAGLGEEITVEISRPEPIELWPDRTPQLTDAELAELAWKLRAYRIPTHDTEAR